MSAIEKFALAALGVVIVYIIFTSQQVGPVIGQIGQYSSGFFGTLQGAQVTFPEVQINRSSY